MARKKKVNLDETNKVDIVIDEDRLNDKDGLDTSFIEGRRSRKIKEAIEEAEANVEIPETKKKKGMGFFSVLFLCLLFCALGGIATYLYLDTHKEVQYKTKILTKKEEVMDINYLFVGDKFFKDLSFDKYLGDSFYVNSSDEKLDSKTLLSELTERVYIYNPSDIFISVGSIDMISSDFDEDDFLDNLEDIIYNIKLNRKYSNIYIESIKPIIDDNIDLKDIKKLNTKIADLCKNEEITFIDTFSLLMNGEELNDKYYENNDLNEDGVDEVFDKIKKYINR